MFAIAFDLIVAETQQQHPKGVTQAYADIRTLLAGHGFVSSNGLISRLS